MHADDCDVIEVVPAAATPTSATPGSEAKILVLMKRVRLRQQLFHPLDVTGGCTRPSTCGGRVNRGERMDALRDEVLAILDRRRYARPRQLARKLEAAPSTVCVVLRRLVAEGLVEHGDGWTGYRRAQ